MSEADNDLRASIAAQAATESTDAERAAAAEEAFAASLSDLESVGAEVVTIADRLQEAASAMDTLGSAAARPRRRQRPVRVPPSATKRCKTSCQVRRCWHLPPTSS